MYFAAQMLDTQYSIQVTSSSDGQERNVRIFYQSMGDLLNNLGSGCTARFGVVVRNNQELNCFLTLASYYFYILKGKHISRICQELPVRRLRFDAKHNGRYTTADMYESKVYDEYLSVRDKNGFHEFHRSFM